jgi:hypothetical protein
MRIGYVRVSTVDQNVALQLETLEQSGCTKVFQEGASGAHGERQALTAALEYLRYIVGDQPMPGRHFHREKVRGSQVLPVYLQKLLPAQASLAPLRSGLQVVRAQDVAHRNGINVVPQIRQSALDAAIAPGDILFSHADDQRFDLFRHTGSSKVATVVASADSVRPSAGLRRRAPINIRRLPRQPWRRPAALLEANCARHRP